MTSLRLKRGTTTQNNSYTGPAGELTMDTTTNQLRLHNGTTAGGAIIGNLTVTSVKTSAYNANVNELVRIDSTAGSFTITLPATPSDGARISFLDITNKCETNPVLVAGNGKTILGDPTGINLDANGAVVNLVFNTLTNNWSNYTTFSGSISLSSIFSINDFSTPQFINNYQQIMNATLLAINGSNKFVTVGRNVNSWLSFSTSANGNTWTTPTTMGTSGNYGIRPGALIADLSGKFLLFGWREGDFTAFYTTSTDGITWPEPQMLPNSQMVVTSAAINSSGRLVVMAYDPYTNYSYYFTSTDGTNWSRGNISLSPYTMYAVCVNSSGRFVAVGNTPIGWPVFTTSTDGVTWSSPAQINSGIEGITMKTVIATSSGRFIAVGVDSRNYPVVTYSDNGTTWSTLTRIDIISPTAIIPRSSAINSNGKIVVVGHTLSTNYPMYATTTDGITWNQFTKMNGSSMNASMFAVACNSSGKFVSVGFDGPGYPIVATTI